MISEPATKRVWRVKLSFSGTTCPKTRMFSESPEKASRACADEIIAWLRTYAETHIDPAAIDERRSIPPHVVLDFGNRGLFGLQVPRRHGGLELTQTDTVRVLQQLAAIDLTLATFVSSHAIGLHTIQKFARASLREELLPALASGRTLSAFCLTERVAGSNPRAIETRADSDGRGGWILNGDKDSRSSRERRKRGARPASLHSRFGAGRPA